ncbi:MAG: alpha/beta hydrolase, partial [Pseudomonadota bacterium]
LIYGEQSAILSHDTAHYMASLMGDASPVVAIPNAHHHVMLDEPLAFVSALRALLETWAR